MTAVDERALTIEGSRLGAFPIAHLLPDSIVEGRRVRRARVLALCGVAAAAGVVALLWVQTGMEISAAESTLSAAQDRSVAIAAEATKYSEVPLVAAQVKNAQADIGTALGGQVAWSSMLTTLGASAPAGSHITRVTGAMPPAVGTAEALAAAAAAKAAGVTPATGGLIVGASVPGYPAVATWLDSMGKLTAFSSPTLTRATVDGANAKSVAAEINVDLTDAALTHRYTQKGATK